MSQVQTTLLLRNSDYQRLLQLIDANDTPAAEALDDEISRAEVVADSQLPEGVVAMESVVTFEDLDSGDSQTVQLVYPAQADVAKMRVSILSPVGSALIGLRIGDSISWPLPQSKVRRLKVVKVVPGETEAD